MSKEPKLDRPVRDRTYYAPYDQHPAFDQGFEDYNNKISQCPYDRNSVAAQAWDRGAEFASYLFWLKHRNTETD